MLPVTVASWSNVDQEHPASTLVVALHGRGADERSMIELARHLPPSLPLAALRAPIATGGGYAWFENRGIGRPVEDSIKSVAAGIFEWLAEYAADYERIALLGFSGGTAMAGGLLLTAPERFAGAALLSGTLPWDAGLDASHGRLTGVPVFWANDVADPVIPRDLVERSEAWLRADSGATLTERHYPGIGHGISDVEIADLVAFLLSLDTPAG